MSEPNVAERQQASAYGVFVACFLAIIYTFNFLDRQLLSTLAEPIRKELHLSDTQIGNLGGLYFALFYTVLGIPIAYLADRTHRVRIIAVCCAIWSVFSAGCGMAQSYLVLAICRMGVGIGEAGGSPPSYSLLSDYFPPRNRGVALAVYSLGVPFGGAIGAALGATVAHLYGWRAAFLTVGAPGVILALLALILVREPKRGRFDAMDGAQLTHEASPPLMTCIIGFATNRTLMLTGLGAGLSAFVGYGILNWAQPYLIRVKGMTLQEIAIYYAILSAVTGGIGTFGSGWLVDRFAKLNRSAYALVPAAASLLSLPFFIGFVLAPTWQISLAFLAVPYLCNNMYLAPALAVVQNAVVPGRRSLSGAILLFMLNIIGLGLGPTFVGMVSDANKPAHGIHSLTYGLLALSPMFIITIIAHLTSAWSISRDTTLAATISAEDVPAIA